MWSDPGELLYRAHRAGVRLSTEGDALTVRGHRRDQELIDGLTAAKAEVLPYLVPEREDVLRAAFWLGWPAVPGIAGTEAAWRAAVRRMRPGRRVAVYAALEALDVQAQLGGEAS